MTNNIDAHIAQVEEALNDFLRTILGSQAALVHTEIEEAGSETLVIDEPNQLSIIGSSAGEALFGVVLEEGWLPLLSKAMLGEELVELSDDSADLIREVVGQAFGSVQSHMAGQGTRLPGVEISVLRPGMTPPSLPKEIMRVSFQLKSGELAYHGFAFAPFTPEAEAPAARPAAPAAMGAARPPEAPRPMPEPRKGAVPVFPASFPDLGLETARNTPEISTFDLLAEVELEVTVELGRRRLPLSDVLRLTIGSVVELEKLVGEPLQIFANNRLIAEGEAVVVDEQFGIRVTSLLSRRTQERAVY